MKITEEQAKVVEAVKTEKAVSVKAYAGSGKTALLVEVAKSQPAKKMVFLAFNVKNADDFKKRMPGNAVGSTAHSFCYKYIKKRKGFNVDTSDFKTFKIIYSNPEYNFKNPTLSKEEAMIVRENVNAMKHLVSLCKNYFVDPTPMDVMFLVNHYGIGINLPADQVASDCIEFLKQSDNDTLNISYDDMIRHPVIGHSVRPEFDLFGIDESQDNTPIRTILFKQMADAGVTVVNVGDEFQSINAWCGADIDAMNSIQKAVGSIVLPLTINFRCGSKIITEAQHFVPDIKAWEGAPEGEVVYQTNEEFLKDFKIGEAALSRFNKVIIPICFKLIKDGKKATIQGKDFGKTLKGMVKDFKATTIDEFNEKIEKWQERQLKSSKSDNATDAINDKFDCLKYFSDNSDTVEQIEGRIDIIFSDEQGEGLKLSTVHKAKGLQWPSTYILDSNNFMQSHPNDKPWNNQQLKNLMYVAQTRPMTKLSYVNENKSI